MTKQLGSNLPTYHGQYPHGRLVAYAYVYPSRLSSGERDMPSFGHFTFDRWLSEHEVSWIDDHHLIRRRTEVPASCMHVGPNQFLMRSCPEAAHLYPCCTSPNPTRAEGASLCRLSAVSKNSACPCMPSFCTRSQRFAHEPGRPTPPFRASGRPIKLGAMVCFDC